MELILNDQVGANIGCRVAAKERRDFTPPGHASKLVHGPDHELGPLPVDIGVDDVDRQTVHELALLVGAAHDHAFIGDLDDPVIIDREPSSAPGASFDLSRVSLNYIFISPQLGEIRLGSTNVVRRRATSDP